MIAGGESYLAGKLADEGLIDVVTDQGGGYGAVIDLIDNLRPRANGIRGMLRARQATHPVRREALMAVTEDWTEAAFTVGEDALAYMQRLVGLQDARVASVPRRPVAA
jgi:DSF synthase